MVLGSTKYLTEMGTRNISWGVGGGGSCLGLTIFPTGKLGSLNFPETEGPIQTNLSYG